MGPSSSAAQPHAEERPRERHGQSSRPAVGAGWPTPERSSIRHEQQGELYTRALTLQIRFLEDDEQGLILSLDALFASHRLTHSRKSFWISGSKPYFVEFGFSGGELMVDLKNGRAESDGRLNGGELATRVTVGGRGAFERSEERSNKIGGGGEIGTKGFKLFSSGESNEVKKRSALEEETISFERLSLVAGGPAHQPYWRLTSARSGECMMGKAPGSVKPGLAVITPEGDRIEAHARFCITQNQVQIIETAPHGLTAKEVPALAVAKKALPKLLQQCCRQDDGLLIVGEAWATIEYSETPTPSAANEGQ